MKGMPVKDAMDVQMALILLIITIIPNKISKDPDTI
jgi:hypothetical protein